LRLWRRLATATVHNVLQRFIETPMILLLQRILFIFADQ